MPHLPPGDPATLVAETRAAFRAEYDAEPLVVGHAPGRVNLIGEHTDYNDGLCLPVALPHRTYVAAAPRADGVIRIASRQMDEPWTGRLDEVAPGSVPGWAAYAVGVLWALAETGLAVPGLDALVDSTVPLGAGLSSSAALECSVAMAVLATLGEEVDEPRRHDLVKVCMRAETEVAGAPTGGMDQTIALLAEAGSALLIDFAGGSTRPVRLGPGAPEILVVDTGVSHSLNDGGYGARRADCEEAARRLGVESLRSAALADLDRLDDERLVRRARHVVSEIARVAGTVEAIEGGAWEAAGGLFVESHASMRDDFEISTPELDLAVESALSAGALGARMTGGGFGGSAVVLVTPGERGRVVAAVEEAFSGAGLEPPSTLVATPSGAAVTD